MSTFSAFQNILPDPTNTIGNAGQVAGTAAEGFASVQITSDQPTLRDRTNSGRLLARAIVGHKWKINIKYNKLTREQFDIIYTFLIHRRGSVNPFFVALPQYSVPKNSAFATYSASNNLEAGGQVAAGVSSVLIGKTGYSSSNGAPTPGDLFTISSANSNHKKAYMVTRVETNADYLAGTAQPGSSQVRIHFTPGLSKLIGSGDDFIFHNPLVRVVSVSDSLQYSLDNNNLYSFSLNLEEAQ